MGFVLKNMLLVTVAVFLLSEVPSTEAGCWEAWSRCTGWSSGATGYLWKSCAKRCRLCAGRASGACTTITDGDCGASQQCKCSGGRVPKSTKTKDRITCRLGL